ALGVSGIIKSLRTSGQSKSTAESLNIRKALILGCVQGIALLPGISRFATTYVAGRWLHLSPRRAFQISFLIQLPLISAAFVQGLYKIVGTPEGILLSSGRGLLTLVLATVIGFFALCFAQKLAYQEKFWWFGFYLLVPTLFLLGSIVFSR
ncbi:undecaprenyl-diphosphate phosphatase, partial [Candidatus Babeliales bacterium]|nr:undecaprenyl-diphosphate phosphatase [Candidatus Babeliales bacterium]